MNDMMLQATLLTRASRLSEATALIQRMLRGETEPDMTMGQSEDIAPTRSQPSIAHAKADNDEEGDYLHLTRLPSLICGVSTHSTICRIASNAIQGPDCRDGCGVTICRIASTAIQGPDCRDGCGVHLWLRPTLCRRVEGSLKRSIPTPREAA
jgi:hypothetical protein